MDFQNRIFIVGGFNRDQLLGFEPEDIDFAVEATEEEFISHFPHAEKVGQNFPVFLIDGNEYALTRTEKSIGDGYGDFAVEEVGVPLVEDLSRRDFTINSIALNTQTGEYFDPFDGVGDIDRKLIRTIFPKAFEEDPLRILRAARFAARYDFRIEPETRILIEQSVHRLQFISKERIVQELKKVFKQAKRLSIFFELLAEFGAYDYILEPLKPLLTVTAGPNQYHHGKTAFEHTLDSIDRIRSFPHADFDTFIAVLFHDVGKGTTDSEILPHHYGHESRSFHILKGWFETQRFDSNTVRFSLIFARHHMRFHILDQMRARKQIKFVLDIPQRFRDKFYIATNCDHLASIERIEIWKKIRSLIEGGFQLDVGRINKNKDPRNEVIRQYTVAYVKEIKYESK